MVNLCVRNKISKSDSQWRGNKVSLPILRNVFPLSHFEWRSDILCVRKTLYYKSIQHMLGLSHPGYTDICIGGLLKVTGFYHKSIPPLLPVFPAPFLHLQWSYYDIGEFTFNLLP